MIQLIAFDLDGTLLLEDHMTITIPVREALAAAAQKGVYLVPATGRLPNIIPQDVMHLHGIDYAVCANGALVYNQKTGEVLFQDHIEHSISVQIMEVLKPYSLSMHIFSGENSYMDQEGIRLAQKADINQKIFTLIRKSQIIVPSLYESVLSGKLRISKITLPVMEEALQKKLWEALSKIDGIVLTSSLPQNIEINSIHANKALGLQRVCTALSVDASDVLAIGDSLNDLEMIRYAGIGVAMKNAQPSIQKESDYITDSNCNDGVAKAIEKFVLSQ